LVGVQGTTSPGAPVSTCQTYLDRSLVESTSLSPWVSCGRTVLQSTRVVLGVDGQVQDVVDLLA
jgi:hypothetical protein